MITFSQFSGMVQWAAKRRSNAAGSPGEVQQGLVNDRRPLCIVRNSSLSLSHAFGEKMWEEETQQQRSQPDHMHSVNML